ncbi:MAG: polymerase sigma factor, sigma-70 family [Verrucomicrobiales bacterium]|nr:polymerase sigma factor, sigma-70 family [Verrucomicrobiales bacterium]
MVITDESPSVEQSHLSRARAGDADAFCLLVTPLQERLLRQAVGLCGDVSAAEDLVSETLVEAWKSLGRFDGNCRLSTWLYSILLHRHYKALRRARSRPISFSWLPFFQQEQIEQQQQNVPGSSATPDEVVALGELTAELRRCVDALSDKHREVILLRFFEDASLSEIAVVLGCSAGTVKSRLHHALENLRKMKMNLPHSERDKQI